MMNIRNQTTEGSAVHGTIAASREYAQPANGDIVLKALSKITRIHSDVAALVEKSKRMDDTPNKARELYLDMLREVKMDLGYVIGLLESSTMPAMQAEPQTSNPGASDKADKIKRLMPKFVNVILEPSDNKMAAMKAVKDACGLGLKEAKRCVDNWPCTLYDKLPLDDGLALKKTLEEGGAKISLGIADDHYEIDLADLLG